MKDANNKTINRRRFLRGAGVTSSALMLQALATGIPARVLLDPLSASAEDNPAGRLLILASSRQGDPINCNVPGTYIQGIDHAPDSSMTATPLSLGGFPTVAAEVWANMPQSILDQLLFFHHGTYTPVHGDMARVQRMYDKTDGNDMLISLLAKETAPLLGTVQDVPLSIGATSSGELLSSQGRLLANVSPLSVKQALAGDQNAILKSLTTMRDVQVDRMYALYREHGTKAQMTLLDSWAKSRDEVRNLSSVLTERLDLITSNDEVDQVKTAAVLAAMKIAPVLTVHIDFGGDNHNDTGLTGEVAKHTSGVQTLVTLMNELKALRDEAVLTHEVVVASLNVFGRTLTTNAVGGRDHNRDHHTMLLMGDGVKAGVVGGLKAKGNDFTAMAIDSQSGDANDNGDIPFNETLGSAGKTLGALLGVGAEKLDDMLTPGKIVQSALA